MLIADDHADPALVAADLLAQAEHDVLASPILLTPSRAIAERVQVEVAKQVEKYEARLEAELKGEPLRKQEAPPTNTIHDTLCPYVGYNGTLAPLAGTALKAVVVPLPRFVPGA